MRDTKDKGFYIDLGQTRQTGNHQRWPSDSDTQKRLKRVTNSGLQHSRTPKFRLGLFLVALFLMVGGLYGIVLLLTEILELEGGK